jgi:outer membrane protein
MNKVYFLAIVLGSFLLSGTVSAQKTLKFGHVNSQEILAIMPESVTAQEQMKKLAEELENQMEQMQVELNTKYEQYLTNRESLTPLIRQTRESELQEMQQRVQMFEQNATQELQRQRNELLQPIFEKANVAIDEVGKEGGFIYIFDVSAGAVLYQSADSEDITPKVKAKLGITQ